MNFTSDIVFKNEDATIINEVKEHFDEVNSFLEDESIKSPLYKVFMFCSYIGLLLDENDMLNLCKIEYSDSEKTANIPRNVLGQHVNPIKELLLCSKFVFSNYDVSDRDLQLIWNMDNANEENELINFVKDRAVLGARYYLNIVKGDEVIQLSEEEVLDRLTVRLDGLLKQIDKTLMQKKIDEDLLIMDL